eukprot:CAMPEP_0198199496 /NCGR_PEP_ID=MMETSP1445-20131203/2787_1 /TAXON_ID=36898 /ORGANISM="Pyramimonas sp., Strain CCMP2087" /LENGTH=407 /DNA_ID=CAMNT_0043869359 /DNA_START=99 /DNA_END=1322 /DNA_ORIENTATION=-
MARLGFVSMLCVVLMVVHFERISGAYDAQDEDSLQQAEVDKQLKDTEREIAKLKGRIARARRQVALTESTESTESQKSATREPKGGARPEMFRTVSNVSKVSIRRVVQRIVDAEEESCSSRIDCPKAKLCVDGACKCPVLYTGPDCKQHIEVAQGKDRCAMGLHHPRFKAEYDEKYKGSFSELAMTKHIEMIKPTADITDRADFSTCAVVGSSGSLKLREYGAEIDNHTAVIRFNDAPTSSFEQWVGDKTTMRIQNLDFCGFSDRTDEMCYAYTAADRPCTNWKGWSRGKVQAKGKCLPMNPSHRNSKYIFWYWRINRIPGIVDPACNPKCGAKMSAGYYGVMLALNVCAKVDIYGFGSETKKALPHYFTKAVTWERKDWALRHHWTYERWCMGHFRENLLDRVRVH